MLVEVATGVFVDVPPTGVFVDVPTGVFVDVPTGVFVDVPTTGVFVTVGITGVLVDVLAAPTGVLVDVPTTGVFVTVGTTGVFVDVPTAGVFVTDGSTGVFVETGVFVDVSTAGVFVMDGSTTVFVDVPTAGVFVTVGTTAVFVDVPTAGVFVTDGTTGVCVAVPTAATAGPIAGNDAACTRAIVRPSAPLTCANASARESSTTRATRIPRRGVPCLDGTSGWVSLGCKRVIVLCLRRVIAFRGATRSPVTLRHHCRRPSFSASAADHGNRNQLCRVENAPASHHQQEFGDCLKYTTTSPVSMR
jgi:hypothetical protein